MKFYGLSNLLVIIAAMTAPLRAAELGPECAVVNEQAIKMVADQHLLAAETKLSEFAQNSKADSTDGKLCLGVTLNNLSAVFERLGKIDWAEQAATRAASVWEETGELGEGALRNSLQLLAQIAIKRGALRKADALLKRSEALPHASHVDLAVSEGLRGDLFLSGGKLADAEEAYKKSLSERGLAGLGSAVAAIPELDNLAILYLNQARIEEALVLLRRAASIADIPSADADLRVETLWLLGVGLARHKDNEADDCFRRAIDLLHEVPAGVRAEIGRTVYLHYAAYLTAAGRKKEGKALVRTASTLYGADRSSLTVNVGSLLPRSH